MSEESPSCYQEEHKHPIDDCGGYYCTLRKIDWCEWFNQDACADCPYLDWED